MNEVAITALLCNLLAGGETELRHGFGSLGGERIVRIDCETPSHVIEVALDGTRSARDSVHQAVFASVLTGKRPMVIVIDSDGYEDRYQQELRIVSEALNIAYGVCQADFIQRWAAAALYRALPNDKSLNDLPVKAVASARCDLDGEFPPPFPE